MKDELLELNHPFFQGGHVVIGDSETIAKGGKFLKRWMGFLEEHADLRYPDPSELNIDLGSARDG